MAPSAARGDLPELAVRGVGDDVERAVGSLPHVADALATIGEQMLLARHAVTLERETHQARRAQAADEQVAAPGGNGPGRVELHARGCDDRVPVIHGLLGAFARGHRTRDRHPRILDAVRDFGPAVVAAALDAVELVAAARAVLDLPQLPLRIERCSLDVAMAERPDF